MISYSLSHELSRKRTFEPRSVGMRIYEYRPSSFPVWEGRGGGVDSGVEGVRGGGETGRLWRVVRGMNEGGEGGPYGRGEREDGGGGEGEGEEKG